MKKIQLLGVCLLGLLVQTAQAQTEKGSVMVGAHMANMSLLFGDQSQFSISLTPKAGYFIENNWLLGATIDWSYAKSANSRSHNIGMGAFSRYYFALDNNPSPRLSPFVEASVSFGTYQNKIKVDAGNYKFSGNYFNLGMGGGVNYFITQSIGLEAGLKLYMHSDNLSSGMKIGPHLTMGANLFFPKQKLKNIYQQELKK